MLLGCWPTGSSSFCCNAHEHDVELCKSGEGSCEQGSLVLLHYTVGFRRFILNLVQVLNCTQTSLLEASTSSKAWRPGYEKKPAVPFWVFAHIMFGRAFSLVSQVQSDAAILVDFCTLLSDLSWFPAQILFGWCGWPRCVESTWSLALTRHLTSP